MVCILFASGLDISGQLLNQAIQSCKVSLEPFVLLFCQKDILVSLLSACPVFCCRSLRKLFLPDSLRRSGFPWCALVLAALHRKVILACSRRFCCQGTLVFNLRIGESPFRKVLSKSLQIFCCLTNRNPQGQFHIQFFEIFKISFTHEAGALWLRDEFSSSQPSETDGSV